MRLIVWLKLFVAIIPEGEMEMNEIAYLQREAKKIKEMYPVGTRVELINMEDPYSPVEAGARGTIEHVDALGQLHMKWDNGRTLALLIVVFKWSE